MTDETDRNCFSCSRDPKTCISVGNGIMKICVIANFFLHK